MTREELRLECLKLAAQLGKFPTASGIVDTARTFIDFIERRNDAEIIRAACDLADRGMSYVDSIIEKLGGTRKAAVITGFATSTVQSWKVSGSIPDRHKTRVAARAKECGIHLSPADFFPSEDGEAA